MGHLHYRVPRRKEKGPEILFEDIMAENFSNLRKETDIEFQKAQRVPTKMNPKRPSPRDIIIKVSKLKERIVKAEKNIYKGTPIRQLAYFPAAIL